LFALFKKVSIMQISAREFFRPLIVDFRYYSKVFSNIGVKSSFFYDDEDLNLIVSKLSVSRYKSALVVNRAKSLLGGVECQN
jgi:hypothetical protein